MCRQCERLTSPIPEKLQAASFPDLSHNSTHPFRHQNGGIFFMSAANHYIIFSYSHSFSPPLIPVLIRNHTLCQRRSLQPKLLQPQTDRRMICIHDSVKRSLFPFMALRKPYQIISQPGAVSQPTAVSVSTEFALITGRPHHYLINALNQNPAH